MAIIRVLEKTNLISLESYQGQARYGELVVDLDTDPNRPTVGVGNIHGFVVPFDRDSVITDRLTNGSEEYILGADGFITTPTNVRQGATDTIMALPGSPTIIYTATTTAINTSRIFIHATGSVTGVDGPTDWQIHACDAIVLAPYDRTAPGAVAKITIYGVIHSSVTPLFNASAQLAGDGRLQLAVQPISATFPIYVKVSATELGL